MINISVPDNPLQKDANQNLKNQYQNYPNSKTPW